MELPVAVTSVIDAAIESVYSLGKYAEPTVVLGKLHERLRFVPFLLEKDAIVS